MRAPASMSSVRPALAALAAITLAGCVGNISVPRIDRPAPPPVQPVQPPPVAASKPTIAINAAEKRVRDTIIERAQSRGTKIIGENTTGVTLEAPLRSTTPRLADICGPHRDGRVVRIYLATIPGGAPRTTIVTEERFVVDTDNTVCAVILTPDEVTEATNALGALKTQAERPATASATPASTTTVSGGTSFSPVRR
jgi:hypothetical protein